MAFIFVLGLDDCEPSGPLAVYRVEKYARRLTGGCGLFLRVVKGQGVADEDGDDGVCEHGYSLLFMCEMFLH